MTKDLIEIAWAAGLFEGEGCIHVSPRRKSKGHVRTLVIQLTDLDVLHRFHRIVGVGAIYASGSNHLRNKKWKQSWMWQTSAWVDINSVLGAFLPFLGNRRREKALALLACMPMPSNRTKKIAGFAKTNRRVRAA